MYTFIQMFISTIFALSISACANAINTQQDKKELVGPEWIVESFEDTSGRKTHPGTVTLKVRFLLPDTLAARADNELWGKYVARDGVLSISKLGGTKRGLSPGSRELEFVEALENANAYTIDGNKLHIHYFNKARALNLLANQ
jgi:hypothetical protein